MKSKYCCCCYRREIPDTVKYLITDISDSLQVEYHLHPKSWSQKSCHSKSQALLDSAKLFNTMSSPQPWKTRPAPIENIPVKYFIINSIINLNLNVPGLNINFDFRLYLVYFYFISFDWNVWFINLLLLAVQAGSKIWSISPPWGRQIYIVFK